MEYTEVVSPSSTSHYPHIRGRQNCACIVLTALLATFVVFTVRQQRLDVGVIILASALPAALLLWGLRMQDEKFISADLLAEMAWRGVFTSAGVAIILESIAMLLAQLELPNCIPDNPSSQQSFSRSLSCDIFLVIFFVVCVGFVEEFAKLLPLCKVKVCSCRNVLVRRASSNNVHSTCHRTAQELYQFAISFELHRICRRCPIALLLLVYC
eukprot:GHVS01084526.1.p1 GENE.GHVS01084526.1~~GHVS01084526.1.p1  ORF type:complete len:212 (-),score=30.48 GHVS01084526.1:53-688(-)